METKHGGRGRVIKISKKLLSHDNNNSSYFSSSVGIYVNMKIDHRQQKTRI